MEVLPGRYYSSDEESEPSSHPCVPSSSQRTGTAGSAGDGGRSGEARGVEAPAKRPLSAVGAADAVQAVLVAGEVAVALGAADVEALVELLAVAKAMPPPSPAAAHVLEGVTRLLSAAAYAAARAQQRAEADDARADAAAERARNARQLAQGQAAMDARARRRFLDDLSQKRAAARKEEAARAARNQRRVRSVGEQCRAAGLVEGCVDVFRARRHEPALLAAAARCLAALAAGDELSAYERARLLQDCGVGAALAAAVRAHGSAAASAADAATLSPPRSRATSRRRRSAAAAALKPPAVPPAAAVEAAHALKDAVRGACSALGLGAAVVAQLPGPGKAAVEGKEAVDPLAALLRDKRFMTVDDLKKAM
jgi:hypothetical protein